MNRHELLVGNKIKVKKNRADKIELNNEYIRACSSNLKGHGN